MAVDDYMSFGEFSDDFQPTATQIREQRKLERFEVSFQEDLQRRHYHEVTQSDGSRAYIWHTHREGADDLELGHLHPDHIWPNDRVEVYGPSLGPETPPSVAANQARAWEWFFSQPKTPNHELMRWKLQLFCGHVMEMTAHSSYTSPERAGGDLRRSCPTCGRKPITIIAYEPLGLAGEPPPPIPPRPRPTSTTVSKADQLAAAEREIQRLRAELAKYEVE